MIFFFKKISNDESKIPKEEFLYLKEESKLQLHYSIDIYIYIYTLLAIIYIIQFSSVRFGSELAGPKPEPNFSVSVRFSLFRFRFFFGLGFYGSVRIGSVRSVGFRIGRNTPNQTQTHP